MKARENYSDEINVYSIAGFFKWSIDTSVLVGTGTLRKGLVCRARTIADVVGVTVTKPC